MAQKEYRCVKKTKSAFEDSLVSLSKEYPINKISVKMICERAQLSRNAFYFHYDDINDLINDIENRMIAEIMALLDEVIEIGFPNSVLVTVQKLPDIFLEKKDTTMMLLDSSYSSSFTKRIDKAFSDFNFEYYKQYNKTSYREVYDIYYSFISNGFYGMFREWVHKPDVITREKFTQIAYILVKRLIMPGDPDISALNMA